MTLKFQEPIKQGLLDYFHPLPSANSALPTSESALRTVRRTGSSGAEEAPTHTP